MTQYLHVTTRSGSTYTMDERGQMTVTRPAEHRLPSRETFTVVGIMRIGLPGGQTRLRIQPVIGGALTTSSLVAMTLPRSLDKPGAVWTRSKVGIVPRKRPVPTQPAARPEPPRELFVPQSTVRPSGVMAVMAVYGD